VRKDLIHAIIAQSRLTVLVKELDDQVLSLRRDSNLVTNRIREVNWTFPDQEVHSMFVAVEEWWNADYHFVDQDTKCPPINCIVVAITNEHFRSQVLCSTAERIGELTV